MAKNSKIITFCLFVLGFTLYSCKSVLYQSDDQHVGNPYNYSVENCVDGFFRNVPISSSYRDYSLILEENDNTILVGEKITEIGNNGIKNHEIDYGGYNPSRKDIAFAVDKKSFFTSSITQGLKEYDLNGRLLMEYGNVNVNEISVLNNGWIVGNKSDNKLLNFVIFDSDLNPIRDFYLSKYYTQSFNFNWNTSVHGNIFILEKSYSEQTPNLVLHKFDSKLGTQSLDTLNFTTNGWGGFLNGDNLECNSSEKLMFINGGSIFRLSNTGELELKITLDNYSREGRVALKDDNSFYFAYSGANGNDIGLRYYNAQGIQECEKIYEMPTTVEFLNNFQVSEKGNLFFFYSIESRNQVKQWDTLEIMY